MDLLVLLVVLMVLFGGYGGYGYYVNREPVAGQPPACPYYNVSSGIGVVIFVIVLVVLLGGHYR